VLSAPIPLNALGQKWVEEWIAFDAGRVDALAFDLRHQAGGQNALDLGLKASLLLQAQAEGRSYRYARLAFDYRAPPSAAQIALLPPLPPPGTAVSSRRVDNVVGGVATEAGRLHSERLTTGVIVDHWMLFENFLLCGPGADVRVGGTPPAATHPSAKAFLTDMAALRQSRGNPVWRYVQIASTPIPLAYAAV
jgi:hypothetical protein